MKSILISIVMILSLVACNNKEDVNPTTTTSGYQQSVAINATFPIPFTNSTISTMTKVQFYVNYDGINIDTVITPAIPQNSSYDYVYTATVKQAQVVSGSGNPTAYHYITVYYRTAPYLGTFSGPWKSFINYEANAAGPEGISF